VLIYAPVTLLFGFLIWYRNGPAPFRSRVIPDIREGIVRVVRGPRRLMALIAAPFGFLVVVPILAILIYLPFYLQMNTLGVQGVFLVMTPTDIVPFLLIHGFFIGIFLLYLAKDIVRRPWLLIIPVLVAIAGYPAAAIALLPLCYLIARQTFRTAEILAAIGLAVIIFCEFLFLKDNMGDVYYRMNTVFKFYLPAWLLMGTAAFCMLGELISPWIRPGLLGRRAGSIISVVIICLFIATPLLLPLDFPYRDHTLSAGRTSRRCRCCRVSAVPSGYYRRRGGRGRGLYLLFTGILVYRYSDNHRDAVSRVYVACKRERGLW
jgi:hypothetical protein